MNLVLKQMLQSKNYTVRSRALLEGLGLLGSIVLLTIVPLAIVGPLVSWLGARRLGRPSES